jgi:hypothetical protein
MMGAAALAAVLAAASAPAEASTVSASFTGHIREMFYVNNADGFAYDVSDVAGIKVNDSFTIDYSYNTGAPIYYTFTSSAGSTGADYYATTFSLALDAFHVALTQPKAEVEDFPDSSNYLDRFSMWGGPFFGPVTSNIPSYSVDGMFLEQYLLPTVLQGIGLPTAPIDPTLDILPYEFQLTLKDKTDTDYYISGTFRPLVTTPVPSALPLFVSALSGFGFLGWRRRHSTATH